MLNSFGSQGAVIGKSFMTNMGIGLIIMDLIALDLQYGTMFSIVIWQRYLGNI